MNHAAAEDSSSMNTSEPKDGLKRDISTYLTKIGFVERVMSDVNEIPGKTKKILLWGGFCLLNILLLAVFGTNPSVIAQFLQSDLGEFFFLFLGISLLGGVVGLVIVSDPSWLQDHLPRQYPEDK